VSTEAEVIVLRENQVVEETTLLDEIRRNWKNIMDRYGRTIT